jgi:hypothetical protein
MSKRAHINLTTKLASALLALGHVPYSDAKKMTAAQIISLYQFHHNIKHGVDVVDEFWNLEPLMIAPHRKRSPADSATVKKVIRNETAHADFCRRVLPKAPGSVRRPARWPKRKMRRANTSVKIYGGNH